MLFVGKKEWMSSVCRDDDDDEKNKYADDLGDTKKEKEKEKKIIW